MHRVSLSNIVPDIQSRGGVGMTRSMSRSSMPAPLAHRRTMSFLSSSSNSGHSRSGSGSGAPRPGSIVVSTVPGTGAEVTVTTEQPPLRGKPEPVPYRERNSRWQEREEVRSIRNAMEQMDLLCDDNAGAAPAAAGPVDPEEERIHSAAQQEAAELVLSHQTVGLPKLNPLAPYRNPDLNAASRKRMSFPLPGPAWNQGLGDENQESRGMARIRGQAQSHRQAQGQGQQQQQSTAGDDLPLKPALSSSVRLSKTPATDGTVPITQNNSIRKKGRVNFALPLDSASSDLAQRRHGSTGGRRVSSGDSSKGVFRNPEDHIFEEEPQPEPQPATAPAPAPAAAAQPSAPEGGRGEHHRLSSVLRTTARNSMMPRGARPLPESSSSLFRKRLSLFENHGHNNDDGHKYKSKSASNPQPRHSDAADPLYTSNPAPPLPSPTMTTTPHSSSSSFTTSSNSSTAVDENAAPAPAPVPTRDGLEIRSDDIRAATSMRLKDRSAKLPTPVAVSDRPGRPIVSFDRSWTAAGAGERPQADGTRAGPKPVGARGVGGGTARRSMWAGNAADDGLASTMPAISVVAGADTNGNGNGGNAKTPVINVNGGSSPESESRASAPSINVAVTPADPSPVRTKDVPVIKAAPPSIGEMQPVPPMSGHHSSSSITPTTTTTTTTTTTSATKPKYYSPYTRAGIPTAACDACGLPISGRIVTAGSARQRFHPECFTCHHCATQLEHVAFYEEPVATRAARLAELQSPPAEVAAAAAREPRFFCHLDFHELFSPRCKSCRTPIEGEAVVALGADWHPGHFFCAECGEPFDATTPFVERGGHAWCVGCHTRRSSPRCAGCKAVVLDEGYVTALGAAWHARCFVCCECGRRIALDEGDADGNGSGNGNGEEKGIAETAGFFVREGPPRVTPKGRQIGGPVKTAVCAPCEAKRLKA